MAKKILKWIGDELGCTAEKLEAIRVKYLSEERAKKFRGGYWVDEEGERIIREVLEKEGKVEGEVEVEFVMVPKVVAKVVVKEEVKEEGVIMVKVLGKLPNPNFARVELECDKGKAVQCIFAKWIRDRMVGKVVKAKWNELKGCLEHVME